MGGGSVHPATAEFNFGVEEAYLIEGGRITRPVKGAALIGRGDEILMNIDMVADDLGDLGYGSGTCGASSGGVPNVVGQPAIRVGGLVVGGR
jgi:TldD protein